MNPVDTIEDEFEFDFAMCHGSYVYCRTGSRYETIY